MKRTVIVVDDEPIIRLDLCQMLEDLNFDVVAEGEDGFDAVEICRQKEPDIVLLDLEMPIFDGMTAAETIVSEGLAGCVVICTAFADESFIGRASQAGVSGYLVKPIEQRMLQPALEVAWAQSQLLLKSKSETEEANKKLEEQKIIERAKGKLAKEKNISESDAYREMQKTAMEKRVSILMIASAILNQEIRKNDIIRTKELLMREKHLSEKEAYKMIAKEAAHNKESMNKAASRIFEKGGIL